VLDKNYFLTLLTEGLSRQANRGIRLVGLHVGLAETEDSKQLVFSFSSTED
jgi:DNA polymerase-4